MNKRKVAVYVRNHVVFYEERLSVALGWMALDRCPLRMADSSLYDEIVDAIEEWCWNNEVDCSEVDWDDVIEGDENGIIWEES